MIPLISFPTPSAYTVRFAVYFPERCFIVKSVPSAADRQTAEDEARRFAIEAARLAANTRCQNVVLMDMRGLSPVTDYMILATGTSSRQMKSVCDEVAELAATLGDHPISSDGMDGDTWMLIDFVDVVVHVFSDEARKFYDLDNLWGDAKRVEWAGAAGSPAGQRICFLVSFPTIFCLPPAAIAGDDDAHTLRWSPT